MTVQILGRDHKAAKVGSGVQQVNAVTVVYTDLVTAKFASLQSLCRSVTTHNSSWFKFGGDTVVCQGVDGRSGCNGQFLPGFGVGQELLQGPA